MMVFGVERSTFKSQVAVLRSCSDTRPFSSPLVYVLTKVRARAFRACACRRVSKRIAWFARPPLKEVACEHKAYTQHYSRTRTCEMCVLRTAVGFFLKRLESEPLGSPL